MTHTATIALTGTPVLETERLVLRAPLAADWPAFRDFALSQRAEFIGGPHALGSAWRAFCHLVGMWAVRGYGSFVYSFKGSDAPLGHVGPWHPADWPEPELGWTVWDPAAEGKGLAFQAAARARIYAYDVLGWSAPVSYIDHGNDRSVALAKRLGAVADPDAVPPPGFDCHVFRHPKVLA